MKLVLNKVLNQRPGCSSNVHDILSEQRCKSLKLELLQKFEVQGSQGNGVPALKVRYTNADKPLGDSKTTTTHMYKGL